MPATNVEAVACLSEAYIDVSSAVASVWARLDVRGVTEAGANARSRHCRFSAERLEPAFANSAHCLARHIATHAIGW